MGDSIHILLLTSRLSPAAGGLASSVPAMAHHLEAHPGVEVTVVGTLDPAAPRAWAKWGSCVQAEAVRGPSALQYAPTMLDTLERAAPDLVDVQGLWTYSSAASLIYFNRHGRPYVVTPRGMLDPWARRNSRLKKAMVRILYERSHLHNARVLRATAEMEAGHFREMGLRNPIAIVPNGVELPALEERVPGTLRRALFLSRIHPKKGLRYLLSAWTRLENSHPDWEVVIAGIDENGHEDEMKSLARQLGTRRVRFLGPVHGREKQKLYRSADVFILPTHAENFGLVVAESLAQGVPVITTQNAPWSGLHTERCGWWIPLTEQDLVTAMSDAMAKPSGELADMGARGRTWMAKAFALPRVADQMKEVYEWVAKGGRRPDTVFE